MHHFFCTNCAYSLSVDLMSIIDHSCLHRFGHVNYEDPHFNVGLPVFSIHGNHDDPAGVVCDEWLNAFCMVLRLCIIFIGRCNMTKLLSKLNGELRVSFPLKSQIRYLFIMYSVGPLHREYLS